MGYDEENETSFEQALAEHITLPPPRHFGKSIAGHFTGTKRSDRHGIFAARILVEGPGGKFWINGLITKIKLSKNSINLVYYDQRGQHFIDIDLEHLAEMQIYKPRDGTYLTIKDEKLVLKQETINHRPEGKNCDLTSHTPPKPEYMDVTETSIRL